MMNHEDGFTLIELMIAIAITAILLGLAAPSFRTFMLSAQVRSATESMQAGLNLARAEALKRNARVSFWLVNDITASCARSASGTSWTVSIDNPANACNAASSYTTAPRLVQARAGSDGSNGVTVTALNSAATAASCITFNGFGGVEPTCTGGDTPISRVSFESSDTSARKLEIRITPGGAVRSCNPTVTDDADVTYCGT